MNMQRGIVGIIIVIIVGLFILIGGGAYLLLKNKDASRAVLMTGSAEADDAPASTVRGKLTFQRFAGTPMRTPPSLASVTPVDTHVFKDQNAIYYKKVSKGTSASGGAGTSEYFELKTAQPAALVRIYPSPSSQNPVPGAIPPSRDRYVPPASSGTGASYYKDSQYVYVLQDSSSAGGTGEVALAVVQAADPATFVLLSDQYAKDSQHVYLITTVCNSSGECTQGLVILQGADLATFQAFEASIVAQSDGTGTVTIDAIDVHNEYNVGVVVDTVSPDSAIYQRYYGTPDPNGLILLAP